MFSTFAIALLLAGPIANITNNAGDLAGVSSCTAEVLGNQTGFLKQLAKDPYEVLVAGNRCKDTSSSILHCEDFSAKSLRNLIMSATE